MRLLAIGARSTGPTLLHRRRHRLTHRRWLSSIPGWRSSTDFGLDPSKIQIEDYRSDHETPPSVEVQRPRVLGVRRHGDAVNPGDPLEEGANK